jgi:nucleotide-binding universal stress UspA family protein
LIHVNNAVAALGKVYASQPTEERTMYKHILVATDGSALAAKGIRGGVKLAKALGARITAVYVVSPFVGAMYSEAAIYYAARFSRDEYKKATEKTARKVLAAAERVARAAGVRCKTRYVVAPQPWQGIVRAARSARCSAIVMASHGRGALGGAILGSETTRVLAHSRIPVVVVR